MNDEAGSGGVLLWLDVETTSLDPRFTDLLEIGMHATTPRLQTVMEPFSVQIAPGRYWRHLRDSDQWEGEARRMHEANGLLHECWRTDAMTIQQARKHVKRRLAALLREHERVMAAGASVHFDIAVLDHQMTHLLDGLHHRRMDVSCIHSFFQEHLPGLADAAPSHATTHRALECLADAQRLYAHYAGLDPQRIRFATDPHAGDGPRSHDPDAWEGWQS
ncbi:exonuclease domain-containing protein [Bifidobacterium sp.]|uniref:exonuclease domain-containing protein n=1 Tax=Bifidobacterium sp. TaxID=41200 RepID=UPI0039EAD6A3